MRDLKIPAISGPVSRSSTPPEQVHSNRQPLSLGGLLNHLDAAGGVPDLQTLDDWLERLEVSPEELCPFLNFDAAKYRRNLVARSKDYEVLVLCWLPGQRSPIHDHSGSNCAVRVLAGEATEVRYEPDSAGRLRAQSYDCFLTGSVTSSADEDMHIIANASHPPQNLVTLHIYSPPLSNMRIYSDDLADSTPLADQIERTSRPSLQQDSRPLPASAIGDTEADLRVPTVAIVGGGFSGIMTAVQIARQSRGKPVRIVIVEPSGRFGTGVAYGTRCTRHLLNVPAGNMSAFPDEPDHFVKWAQRHRLIVAPDAFMPRYWYGVYLHSLLEEARAHARIDCVSARVLDIIPGDDGARLILDQGEDLWADQVVMAGGNFAPSQAQLAASGLVGSERYIRDPWKPRALGGISAGDTVLLVGTGLTMVDVVVQLRSTGHQGPIHAVSRRGLLPQAHRKPKGPPSLTTPPEVLEAPRTALGLLRGIRQAIRRLEREGYDWRDVINSLRSRTTELWSSLDLHERRRFLRHLRPFWDTHRHRIPASVSEHIERLREAGTLMIHRGRIVSAQPAQDGMRVALQPRDGSTPREVTVCWVVNCTGPDSDVRCVGEPLWDNLMRRGIAKPEELGLGVLTSPEGAIIDQNNTPSDCLALIGPLRKAQLWESTAVPELRVQAAQLAGHLLGKLAPLIAEHQSREEECMPWNRQEAPAFVGMFI